MVGSETHMKREIAEIPAATARFLDAACPARAQAAQAMQELDPDVIITVARGSSDHAASYLKYAIELLVGIPVASVGPSVASIYRRPLRLKRAAAIGISQSGQSPDIVEMMRAASAGGAVSLAITNAQNAPITQACAHTLLMRAGEEKSVAATKTFVASVVAGLSLLAEWQRDDGLRDAVAALPDQFHAALQCDWDPLADMLADARQAFILGRGPGFAIAAEMALKCKETCDLHAESYSAAEVLHGPSALVKIRFPVIALGVADAALPQVIDTAERLAAQGADVFLTGPWPARGVRNLPAVTGAHPLTGPLVAVVSFYAFAERLARQRGLNPDLPPNLRKVTSTI